MDSSTTMDEGLCFYPRRYPGGYPLLIKTIVLEISIGQILHLGYYYEPTNKYYSVKQCADKGFIITSTSQSTVNYNYSSGWLIKTDSLGNTNCYDSSAVFSTSIVPINVTTPSFSINALSSTTISRIIANAPVSYSLNCQPLIDSEKESIQNGNKISIFPNPSNGEFKIKNEELKIENIEIYNIQGEKIYEAIPSHIKQENFKMDLSNQAPGIYLMKIVSKDLVECKRIIIE